MKFLKVWWTCIAAITVLVVLSVVLVRGMGMEVQAWQEIFSAFYTVLGVSLIPTVFAGYIKFENYRKELITYRKELITYQEEVAVYVDGIEEWNGRLIEELDKIEKVMYKEKV